MNFYFTKRQSCYSLLACLIFICTGLWAQEYLVHSYNTDNGLPSSTVNDIAQDDMGNMWFATRAGVSRYNGYEWQSYRSVDGIEGSDFIAIEIDSDNRPWALCRFSNLQVYYFDNDYWKKLPDPPISKTHRYSLRGFTVTHIDEQPVVTLAVNQKGIYVWQNNLWHHIDDSNGLSSLSINAVAADSNFTYVATADGLIVLEGAQLLEAAVAEFDLPSKNLLSIAVKDPGQYRAVKDSVQLWLAGEDWIGYTDQSCFHSLDVPLNSELPPGLSMTSDRQGGLYLDAGDQIVHVYGPQHTVTTFDEQSGLFSEKISTIFVDFEFNTWVAFAGGLKKLPGQRFANYRHQHGLLSDAIESAWMRSDGRLYFGHKEGFTVFENGQFSKHAVKAQKQSSRFHTRVEDFAEDASGNLWAASTSIGLLKINEQNDIQHYLPPPQDAILVSAVAVDNQGQTWIGTDNGLYQLHERRYMRVPLPPENKVYIREIVPGRNGRLLIATPDYGIFQIHNGEIRNYHHPSESGANNVYAIYEDESNTVWAGTFAGLYVVDKDRLRFFEDGSISIRNHVYSILQDSKGHYWYGTDNGLLRRDNETMVAFGVRDGLIGPETSRSASLVDRNDDIWIGTPIGLSHYRKKFDIATRAPGPRLTIDNIDVNGKQYSLDHDLILEPDQSKIKLYFKATSFLDEHNIQYETQLDGFDEQTSLTDQPYIEYTNLPPGNYRFQVRAVNAAGVWSNWQKTPAIYIAAPFVETVWFYITLIFLATILGYFGHYLKSRDTYMRLLEAELHEQTYELRSSEEKYRSLFEASEDVVFISTRDAHFLDINQAGIKLFGYESKGDMLQADIAEDIFVKSEDWESLTRNLKNHGSIRNMEIPMKHRDGQQIIALVSGTCLLDKEEHLVGYRGIIRDITEHRNLEQQFYLAQKMESIGLLAGGIAHDFNNILASILGYASLMKETLPPKSEEQLYIDTIEKSADRGAELTSQLLGFARGGKYNLCPVDLNEIVQNTLEMIARTFNKNIEIKKYLEGNPAIVEGDATQLQQVILNLCVNARDAMPNGGTLTILTEHLSSQHKLPAPLIENGKSFLRLTIQDTGSGMSKKVQERIFEPFFTTKQVDQGTGLGLSMVYGVIKNHAGWIQLDSQPGSGTRFEVFLPTTTRAVKPKPAIVETETTGTETILVVDDEEIIRQLLQESLYRAGYKVIPAEDGEMALKILEDRHNDIDLIILDMIMPRMSGVKTLSELEKINGNSKVLIATGYSKPVEVEQLKGKISGILQKPFKVHTLLAKVRSILDEND